MNTINDNCNYIKIKVITILSLKKKSNNLKNDNIFK